LRLARAILLVHIFGVTRALGAQSSVLLEIDLHGAILTNERPATEVSKVMSGARAATWR
jgi:hypothetical protein